MDKQAREARKMAKDLPFPAKVAHIWTYYKWWIIGIPALLLIIGMSVYEAVTAPTYDLEISYYGEKILSDETIEALKAYLAEQIEDVDGDGEKTVQIYVNSVSLSGDNPEVQMAMQTKLVSEIAAKQYFTYLFDHNFAQLMQKGSYSGSMEVLRDVTTSEKLMEVVEVPDGMQLYWGVRAIYEEHKEKEENLQKYQTAKQTEQTLFGERTEPLFPPVVADVEE